MATRTLALLLVAAFALAAVQGVMSEDAPARKLLASKAAKASKQADNAALALLTNIAAGRSSDADKGADAVVRASRGDGNSRKKAASAIVDTADNKGLLARLLARTARKAASQDDKKAVAATQTDALLQAKSEGSLPQLASATAESLPQSGGAGQEINSMALSSAMAQGPAGQSAVAESAATVYCDKQNGNLQPNAAAAWGSSFAVAVAQDPNTGCVTLTQALSTAVTTCGPTGAQAIANDSSLAKTLSGTCGLPPGIINSISMAGGITGSTSTGNAGGSATAGGSTTVPSPRPNAQLAALQAQLAAMNRG